MDQKLICKLSFVKIDVVVALIVIQVIGITLLKNGNEIRHELPINGNFYAIDRRGENIFDRTG